MLTVSVAYSQLHCSRSTAVIRRTYVLALADPVCNYARMFKSLQVSESYSCIS